MKSRIINLILVVASTLVAFLLVEAAYRYRLYHIRPTYFIQEANQPRSVSFYSHSIWEFDEDLGFRYRRDSPVLAGAISNGKLAGCGVLDPKEYGGIGKKERWTENADLRILVLGDSFTAISENGRSWPDYLQDELQHRLGKRVDVINLGMDGIGILQMFDVAAVKAPALKPDLMIFAFITDDLTRARIWRTTAHVDGRTRVFTTTKPQRTPDLRYAADAYVINDKVTLEWCNKSPKPQRIDDPLIQDLEYRYRLGIRLANVRADLYALNRSFVMERIIHGSPSAPREGGTNPRHDLVRFSDDERAKLRVELVKKTAPVMLLHLVTRTELGAKKAYLFREEDRERRLLDSLKALTGTEITETGDFLPSDLLLDAMGASVEDDHPSAYGMRIYAGAAAEAFVRRR